MQPSWENAPKWANWLSQNELGKWFWSEGMPLSSHDGTSRMFDGRFVDSGLESDESGWQSSCERRPAEWSTFEPGGGMLGVAHQHVIELEGDAFSRLDALAKSAKYSDAIGGTGRLLADLILELQHVYSRLAVAELHIARLRGRK